MILVFMAQPFMRDLNLISNLTLVKSVTLDLFFRVERIF